MKRTVFFAALIALSPVLAQAECAFHKEQTAMSCAEGLVYDQQQNACVKVTS